MNPFSNVGGVDIHIFVLTTKKEMYSPLSKQRNCKKIDPWTIFITNPIQEKYVNSTAKKI